jgi:FkbM family methyltransferase
MDFPARVLRWVYPLRVRQSLFYRYGEHLSDWKSTNRTVALEFAPDVKLSLLASDRMHQCISATGLYELQITRRIHTLAKQGGLLVDVGANIGYYTCLWASHLKNSAVAFEPSPRNLQFLQQNVDDNDLQNQVQIVPQAVGRTQDRLSFDPGPNSSSGHGSLALGNHDRSITVDQTSLDAYFEDSETEIDVLKIDIEGADTWALEGAQRLLEEHRIGNIFFEHYPLLMDRLGIEPDRSLELLAAHGYETEQLGPNEFHASLA